MSTLAHTGGFLHRLGKEIFVCMLSLVLVFATLPLGLSADQDAQAPANQGPTYAQQTPEQLQRLVAPIALYPDSLVAQILAASTFPEQVVEADRWLQEHPDLKGEALAQAADQQTWDPSVKALTAFPSVLGNMDKNISWTSALGDAYYNQQQDVMDAIQVMRQKAKEAGNLKSTQQQTVTNDDYGDVSIVPASPDVIYVPAYNPWWVYGYPIAPWPGWYPYPGIWYGGPYISFGIGFGIGWFAGFGWGWGHWGCDWHQHYPVYNHYPYYSQSRTFYNRNYFYRGGGAHGGPGAPYATHTPPRLATPPPTHGVPSAPNATHTPPRLPPSNVGPGNRVFNRPGATAKPFEGNTPAARGYAQPSGQSGTHSGAFSNYGHGGESRSYSSRGSSSVGHSGGGGAPHGGGGGGGGGGHAGGHR